MDKFICVFGDSTAWGAWDTEKGGWVNRLWLEIGNRRDKSDYVELYNCSISGGTTDTILERFESEANSRGATTLIFQTGGNDSAYQATPENFLVPVEKFKENIEEIIKLARNITDSIIFTDLKNCDESKTVPVPWIDIYYKNENIKKYSEIMKEVCRDQNVLFLDMPDLANDEFEDGLHPNDKGHKKIFEVVKNFLIQQKLI